jgi:hypothetical protein
VRRTILHGAVNYGMHGVSFVELFVKMLDGAAPDEQVRRFVPRVEE